MSEDGQVTIVDGPSKFDLMVAFFDRFGPYGTTRQRGSQKSVAFATGRLTSSDRSRAGAVAAIVKVDSLAHEDGSGHSFMFTGRLAEGTTLFRGSTGDGRVEGYYNSRTREGFIKAL